MKPSLSSTPAPEIPSRKKIAPMIPNTILSLRARRSRYDIRPDLPLPREQVEALIREAVRLSPSTYNSQGSRVVILFGAESRRFWDLTRETLRPMIPAEKFDSTDRRMTAFGGGAGTVLFFEDQEVVRGLMASYPLYADNFPAFSEQASGMAQLAVWMTLAEIGVGASLQHYNPLVDAEVARIWDLPASWKLRCQMPFGAVDGAPRDKTFIDDEVRFRSFG